MPDSFLNVVTIEVTNRCQSRCRMCGIWREKDRQELSCAQVVRALERLSRHFRIKTVSITGGEPLLHPDLENIIRHLLAFRNKGKIKVLGLYSNGMFTAALRRLLSSNKRDLQGMFLGISLDGVEKTHDHLRGRGSFRKAIASLAMVTKEYAGVIKPEVKFTINRFNYREMIDVYQIARRYQAEFLPKLVEIYVPSYYHRHPCPEAAAAMGNSQEMLSELRHQTLAIARQEKGSSTKLVDVSLLKMLLRWIEIGKNDLGRCRRPEYYLFISSSGKTYSCGHAMPVGSALTGNFPSPAFFRRRQKVIEAASVLECPGCPPFRSAEFLDVR
ncbi:MAG: radical SAM protein [Candidatus Omnitrophica bacterium]|nr:radical SAM protein [Candidatus Omnitrophota bacterium]